MRKLPRCTSAAVGTGGIGEMVTIAADRVEAGMAAIAMAATVIEMATGEAAMGSGDRIVEAPMTIAGAHQVAIGQMALANVQAILGLARPVRLRPMEPAAGRSSDWAMRFVNDERTGRDFFRATPQLKINA